MPPAVEIARAIGATPVSLMGMALISLARSSGENEDSDRPDEIAASCIKPITTGERLAALRRKLAIDCLLRDADKRAVNSLASKSGRKATCSIASLVCAIASRNSADSA